MLSSDGRERWNDTDAVIVDPGARREASGTAPVRMSLKVPAADEQRGLGAAASADSVRRMLRPHLPERRGAAGQRQEQKERDHRDSAEGHGPDHRRQSHHTPFQSRWPHCESSRSIRTEHSSPQRNPTGVCSFRCVAAIVVATAGTSSGGAIWQLPVQRISWEPVPLAASRRAARGGRSVHLARGAPAPTSGNSAMPAPRTTIVSARATAPGDRSARALAFSRASARRIAEAIQRR